MAFFMVSTLFIQSLRAFSNLTFLTRMTLTLTLEQSIPWRTQWRFWSHCHCQHAVVCCEIQLITQTKDMPLKHGKSVRAGELGGLPIHFGVVQRLTADRAHLVYDHLIYGHGKSHQAVVVDHRRKV